MEIFESKMGFHDPRCFHPGSENILLRRDIIWLCYSVQVIEITENKQTTNTVITGTRGKNYYLKRKLQCILIMWCS